MTGENSQAEVRTKVLEAARFHVTFDGFSDAVLSASAKEAGISEQAARASFPRGAADIAYEFHLQGDAALADAMASMPGDLRYSAKVAWAVMKRLEIAGADRELVRRAAAFFALPLHAATGARALWHTADTIWTGLGDTSTDVNWYSKRAILSGVYSASLLFWLGDQSPNNSATEAFVDRRIGDVMRFEKTKASLRKSPFARAFMAGPGRLFDNIRAPDPDAGSDLPGHLKT